MEIEHVASFVKSIITRTGLQFRRAAPPAAVFQSVFDQLMPLSAPRLSRSVNNESIGYAEVTQVRYVRRQRIPGTDFRE